MYQRVEELTVIVREQRRDWNAKIVEQHPDVNILNADRVKYFGQRNTPGGNERNSRVLENELYSDDDSLFDENSVAGDSKKPRYFKDGIL